MGVCLTKNDVARRQIETAIELLFEGRDPVSVHTVANAAGRIVRDLCENKGTPLWGSFKKMIPAGKQGEFFKALGKAAAFFRHADHDAEQSLDEVKDELNDAMIFLAIWCYVDLGNAPTKPMRAFLIWFTTLYPDLLLDDTPLKATFKDLGARAVSGRPRAENLALGLSLLREDPNVWLRAALAPTISPSPSEISGSPASRNPRTAAFSRRA